ncbi:hypothetical protein N806_13815 [Rhodococcus sp. P27]|nr:hypothetical protein N806_13455 [Rhodococcus sp. P27]ERB52246.1 hypothetical protein N806_13815 [Rhodococcus sp. P27]
MDGMRRIRNRDFANRDFVNRDFVVTANRRPYGGGHYLHADSYRPEHNHTEHNHTEHNHTDRKHGGIVITEVEG